jgi:hypothetical protein
MAVKEPLSPMFLVWVATAVALGVAAIWLAFRTHAWIQSQPPQRRKVYAISALAIASIGIHALILGFLPKPPRIPGRPGRSPSAGGDRVDASTLLALDAIVANDSSKDESNVQTAKNNQDNDNNDSVSSVAASHAITPQETPSQVRAAPGPVPRIVPSLVDPRAVPATLPAAPLKAPARLAATTDDANADQRASSGSTNRDTKANGSKVSGSKVKIELPTPPSWMSRPSLASSSSVEHADVHSSGLIDAQWDQWLAASMAKSPTASLANTLAAPDASRSDLDINSGNIDPTIPTAAPSALPPSLSARRGVGKQRALQDGGGDESTEATVDAGLQWLARNQSSDGHWDPIATGAGNETRTLGHDRLSAGRTATTGLTGLALLAFLGAGHTPESVPYGESVGGAITFLCRAQGTDGSLAGGAARYEAMYCHGIASLALAEALAMTGDIRLEPFVDRALRYTRGAQHQQQGGWRYLAGVDGDTSQLGWQALALHSGRLSGIEIPAPTMQGIDTFLQSVQRGNYGGLASYRYDSPASRPMTAEALAVRWMLQRPLSQAAMQEAEQAMLGELPGSTKIDNYYYWYYAALALHGLDASIWPRWNEAMKDRLQRTQILDRSKNDGSWPTGELWGGYGGQVYTTSMASLCLEVYYRHLPMQQPLQTARANMLQR